MHTNLYSLSRLFSDAIFRIPDYQRGYAWNERQLRDFWSDINLLEEDSSHYTGVLTLQEVVKSDCDKWEDDSWIIESRRYKPYYVVDGQQRLTTALILIQAIIETCPPGAELNYTSIDKIREKYIFEARTGGTSKSYLFGYEKDNPSYYYLISEIFKQPLDSHSNGENTIYTYNLDRAKKYFLTQLKELSSDQLASVYKKLTHYFRHKGQNSCWLMN